VAADVHPVGPGSDVAGQVVNGQEHNVFVEQYELQPSTRRRTDRNCSTVCAITPTSSSGAKLQTFHDQIGHWLWEPAAHTVLHTLSIPRGQVVLAAGIVDLNARAFEVSASLGLEICGTLSKPFLDRIFHTVSFRLRVTVNHRGGGEPIPNPIADTQQNDAPTAGNPL
jgi:hypothetical protein